MKKTLALAAGVVVLACAPKPKPVESGHAAAAVPGATAAVAAAPSPTPPPKPIVLPKMEEETLPNGLTVLLVEDHELPTVSFTLQFPHGSDAEPAELAGVTSMTTELLREGTKTRTAAQIAEQIDFVGGDLGDTVDDDFMRLSARVLKKDFDVALGLLADEVLNATFPKEELEDLRRQHAASVKQRFDDPSALSSLHAQLLAYGPENPYSRLETEKTVAAIKREDIVRFRDTWLVPGGATLAIAGDVDASVFPKVRAAFGSWKTASPPTTNPQQRPQAKLLRIVDKPDLTQSFVNVVIPGIMRRSPDFYAARLMETAFGNGFSSRLTKIVRTENGKTYDVSGSFDLKARLGVFALETSTRTSETVPTISLMLSEMKKLQTQEKPITAWELSQAKAILIGGFPRRFETPGQVTGQILWARLTGLPLDELRGYREKLAEVTLSDVNAAAKKYLDASNAIIVVCGNAAEVKAPLEKEFGPAEVVDYRSAIGERKR